MKVLVTGGAGFIGSSLDAACLAEGHAAVVVDNLERGRRERVPTEARFHRADVCDRAAIESILRAEMLDAVAHLAARASVRDSVRDAAGYIQVNVYGTARVLEAAARVGIPRFLFASSAAVYGHTGPRPAPEEAPPRPLSPHGLQKAIAESLVRGYSRALGTSSLVLPALRQRLWPGPGPRRPLWDHCHGAPIHARRPPTDRVRVGDPDA